MIKLKYFLPTVCLVCGIAILGAILQYFGIPTVFYLWEIAVDIKLLTIISFLSVLYKTNNFVLDYKDMRLVNWNLKSNFIYFFWPLIISAIVVGIGTLLGTVTPSLVENRSTLILASLFDIPAIFVFSATTILIEEIFFRSILVNSILSYNSRFYAFFFVGFVWAFYTSLGLIDFSQTSVESAITIFFNQFVIGIFLSNLVIKLDSVWGAYSFRVGTGLVSSIFLKSIINDSDPFFTTNSMFFVVEGWIFSLILLLVLLPQFRFFERIMPVKGDLKNH